MKTLLSGFVVAAVVAGALCVSTHASAKEADLDCKLRFSLTGWSLIYKTASGTGNIHCSNGQSMAVKVGAKGGGITFGKNRIRNGFGQFANVGDIRDVLGSYATAEAHAGTEKSASAQAMTNGKVSLALSGKGKGWSLGVAFSRFAIEAAN